MAKRLAPARKTVLIQSFAVKPSVVLSAIKIASPLLGFVPIQAIERKQDPGGLVAKRGFIAAGAVKREFGELASWKKQRANSTPRKVGYRFHYNT
jgi:hypothetical protein